MQAIFAQDVQQRLAIIRGLKLKGIVGEGNDGLLKFRGKEVAKEIVTTENGERAKTYAKVAKTQGKTPQEVGKQSAILKAQSAKPGEWIQGTDGSWKKK